MVTWTRKVQETNGQYRITLPKRWIEDKNLQDKDAVDLRDMKRESALKITVSEEG
ncbi:MAG: hypothetical protein SVW02_03455 [Candidatus Nanohaloarchaea archaeon]|nr:hypothetical protein [Candidatus Nanohaloarchaea archaeon]